MGWWNVDGSKAAIGDQPLELLREAVREIAGLYVGQFGRKPTKLEWESLLFAVLGEDEEEARVLASGVVSRVELTVTPK